MTTKFVDGDRAAHVPASPDKFLGRDRRVPLRRVDIAGADTHDFHAVAAYVIHQLVQFPLLPLSLADFDVSNNPALELEVCT